MAQSHMYMSQSDANIPGLQRARIQHTTVPEPYAFLWMSHRLTFSFSSKGERPASHKVVCLFLASQVHLDVDITDAISLRLLRDLMAPLEVMGLTWV